MVALPGRVYEDNETKIVTSLGSFLQEAAL